LAQTDPDEGVVGIIGTWSDNTRQFLGARHRALGVTAAMPLFLNSGEDAVSERYHCTPSRNADAKVLATDSAPQTFFPLKGDLRERLDVLVKEFRDSLPFFL
jgi:hypothetical protein